MDISISDDGFVNTLRLINDGAVVAELDASLTQAVAALFDHGGKAEIVLKLKLTRIKNMDTAVTLTAETTKKLPKEEPASKAFFVTPTCGLSDQPQEQQRLPLGPETERQRAKLVIIDPATGEIQS